MPFSAVLLLKYFPTIKTVFLKENMGKTSANKGVVNISLNNKQVSRLWDW